MKKEELRKTITKSIEEQKNIIENTNSVSYAAREILGIDSTLARTIIKEICNEQGWEIPTWYNRVRYCLNCGKPIIGGDSKKKFCNNSCAASYNNKLRSTNKEKVCLNCGKSFLMGKNTKGIFCSNKCQMEYKHKEYIRLWKLGEKDGMSGPSGISSAIRSYLFEKYNNKCQICGWGKENPHTHKVPLQIHHIDGNCTNNKEENLQLLCPNCHSLTETFGGSNENSKRLDRRLKYVKTEIEEDKNKDITEVSRCIICGKKLEKGQMTFCSQRCYKRSYIKNITKEQILDAFNENKGSSYEFISKKLGISKTTLERKCKQFGIMNEIRKLRYGE
jgi:predicted nucleic acid-binding Zn ribbon protein